jgi:hypothetical protein
MGVEREAFTFQFLSYFVAGVIVAIVVGGVGSLAWFFYHQDNLYRPVHFSNLPTIDYELEEEDEVSVVL